MIHNTQLKAYLDQFPVEEWKNRTYGIHEHAIHHFNQIVEDSDVIIIMGDYDTDGICASEILKKGIKGLYPDKSVAIILPDRFRDGYGIHNTQIDKIHRVLRQLQEKDSTITKPTIITCDNGISGMDTIQYARQVIPNIQIIVTDHHLPKTLVREDDTEELLLPDADLILNPKIPGQTAFSCEHYCGAGVVYKIMMELGKQKVMSESLRNELTLYAGIATVADMVPMVEDNWKIVRESIKLFRHQLHSKELPEAFRILFSKLEIEHPSQIHEDFYGYTLSPLLNAMGRLQDYGAQKVIRFLDNPTMDGGDILIHNNQIRKGLVADTANRLVEKVANRIEPPQKMGAPIWVYIPSSEDGAEEGLCGLYAQKLTDTFHAPAIVLTNSRVNPQILKGSGRNVEGFDLFSYLQKTVGDKVLGFGGHKEACGMTCTLEQLKTISKLDCIREADAYYEKVEEGEKSGIFYLNQPDITELIVDYEEIKENYAPFGMNYPRPSYAIELDSRIHSFSSMGEGKHFCTELVSENPGGVSTKLKLLHFNHNEGELHNPENFMACGFISENYYKGRITYQLIADTVSDISEREREEELEPEEERE